MNTTQNLADLAGRILIAAIFLIAGLNKIGGYEGTQGYMAAMGVPGMLLPLVIALEVVGAIAIIFGWRTRLFAFLLAIRATKGVGLIVIILLILLLTGRI